ncbi:hypothetical protein CCYA_CCYA13G3566 [Cyanidiococcus yangmingshanensis]|nr:hypothetical protein CCYA_CCYA13G3566 [Cyanidiococcus yangmingshanensis]
MPSLVSRVSRPLSDPDDDRLSDHLAAGTTSDQSTTLSTAVSADVGDEPGTELPIFYAESYRALLVDLLLLVPGTGRNTPFGLLRGQLSGSREETRSGVSVGSETQYPTNIGTSNCNPSHPSGLQRPSRFDTPHGSLNTILQTLERAQKYIRAENICEKYIPGTPAATFEVLDPTPILQSWRVRDRLKTAAVALILCLNVGVDPPDVIKPTPCARMECWIDPFSMSPQKALDSIGKALQLQYERWQPRARYRVLTDPIVDEVKKLCLGLRRTAKDERVLFHFNGHGVPKPTANGEIWVFNKNYTQYIPLSLYDLQAWLGAPAVYVFDCPAAGLAISAFLQFAEQREREEPFQQPQQALAADVSNEDTTVSGTSTTSAITSSSNRPKATAEISSGGDGTEGSGSASNASNWTWSYRDSFLLGACQAHETLPTSPDMPADLFTACLTTPIRIALRWHVSRSVCRNVTPEMIDRIPGRLNDRKTMLGELNWIFTAVTDTIAWNTFPRATFKRLYRQDLLVASLFRNFLLADRLMRQMNCTPVSYPPLPPTHQHPLWQAWDHAVELCFARLPEYLRQSELDAGSGPTMTPSSPMALGVVGPGTVPTVTKAAPDHTALPAVVNHLMHPKPMSNLDILHNLYDQDESAERTQGLVGVQCPPGYHPSPDVDSKSTITSPQRIRSADSATIDATLPASSDQRATRLSSEHSPLLPSPFFENQMAAFEVWLDLPAHRRRPPEQLPIVLQVLLSQAHRLRALQLLSRFLDTGPWAVDLALSVGIFPYVLRLLQSPASELRAELVFIWAKILAVDPACTADLLKENGERYFLSYFASEETQGVYLACAAFVLYMVLNTASDQFAEANLLALVLQRLEHPSEPVRRWTLLCLAAWLQSTSRMPSEGVVSTVLELLRTDLSPKVRAAAVQTLAVMMRLDYLSNEIAEAFQQSALNEVAAVVRKEIALVKLPANAAAQRTLADDPHPLVAGLAQASMSQPHCSPEEAFLSIESESSSRAQPTQPTSSSGVSKYEMEAVTTPSSAAIGQNEQTRAALAPVARGASSSTAMPYPSGHPAETLVPCMEPATSSSPSTMLRRASASLSNLLRHSWSTATLGLASSPERPSNRMSSLAKETSALECNTTDGPVDIRSVGQLPRPWSHPNLFPANMDGAATLDASAGIDTPVGECRPLDLFRYRNVEFTPSPTRRMMHLRDFSVQEVLQSHTRQRWMGVEPCTPSLIQTGTSMRRDSEEASRLRERWVCRLEQGGDIWALTFHPSQPLVLVGDALGRVTALDREHGSLHWSFRVPRAEGGIAALHVVNAHTTWPLLLVATADGTIRVYESQMQLLAAFAAISRPTEARSSGEAETPYRHERGLEGVSVSPSAAASDAPDPSRLIPTAPTRFEDKHRNEHNTTAALHTSSSTSDSPEVKPYTSGIQTTSISTTSSMTGRVDHAPPAGRSFVCDWSPWHGWLLSGGLEQGTIRLFDAEREMCIWSCIASSYQVTAVAHIRPDLFMVGCADGAVYGYDARTGAAELELLEHSSPVLAIEGRASPTPALVTAAAAGDVRIWPEMASDSAVCVVAHRRDLTATAVHRNLPWMATGSASRSIKLFGEQGQLMKLIRHHDGPDAARIGPVSCLKFDETSPLLAAGDMDSVVTLYADRVESIRQMAS